jgi:hypothetical protein
MSGSWGQSAPVTEVELVYKNLPDSAGNSPRFPTANRLDWTILWRSDAFTVTSPVDPLNQH